MDKENDMTLRQMLENMGSLRGRMGTNEQERWKLMAMILTEICESQGIDLDYDPDHECS